MPEIITCPKCLRKLLLPLEILGKEVRCPSCSTDFVAALAPAPTEVRELTPEQNLEAVMQMLDNLLSPGKSRHQP